MHGLQNGELRKELNGSAAWLAGMSPIGSPVPRQGTPSALQRHSTRVPLSPPLEGRHTQRGMTTATPSAPLFEPHLHPPSLYPHLVRSHSPPGRRSPSPSSTAQRRINVRGTTAPTSGARVSDTFADVLAREWPFTPTRHDAPDVIDAVRFGQESALMHYANDGLNDVARRLAPEVTAVTAEAERWRLAAQHSTLQCQKAVRASAEAKEELRHAQQQLQTLRAQAEMRKAVDMEGVARSDDNASQLCTPASDLSDSSVAALTLQLDKELNNMRTQRRRYEVACVQRARLETQLEGWAQKEKKLAAKLERVQAQRGTEIGSDLHSARTGPRPVTAVTAGREAQRPSCGSWERDLDVCITERVELLRHLQGGTARRLEQLKGMLTRLEAHSGDGVSETAAPLEPATHPLWILDRLSTIHQSVSLGEEEALLEMEHLRVLLHRLQRQERRDSAVGQQSI